MRKPSQFALAVLAELATPCYRNTPYRAVKTIREIYENITPRPRSGTTDAEIRRRESALYNRVVAALEHFKDVEHGRDWLLIEKRGGRIYYGIKPKYEGAYRRWFKGKVLPDLPVR